MSTSKATLIKLAKIHGQKGSLYLTVIFDGVLYGCIKSTDVFFGCSGAIEEYFKQHHKDFQDSIFEYENQIYAPFFLIRDYAHYLKNEKLYAFAQLSYHALKSTSIETLVPPHPNIEFIHPVQQIEILLKVNPEEVASSSDPVIAQNTGSINVRKPSISTPLFAKNISPPSTPNYPITPSHTHFQQPLPSPNHSEKHQKLATPREKLYISTSPLKIQDSFPSPLKSPLQQTTLEPKSQFLAPFESLYEKMDQVQKYNSILREQARKSFLLLQTLQGSSDMIDGLVNSKVNQIIDKIIGTRLKNIESRLDGLEGINHEKIVEHSEHVNGQERKRKSSSKHD